MLFRSEFIGALPLGFIRLYCGPCHDLGLAWHLQCVGCDKKILWPSVGLSLGLIGTCWYFFGLIGSRWYVVAFGGNGHQTDHHGLRSFAPGRAFPHGTFLTIVRRKSPSIVI